MSKEEFEIYKKEYAKKHKLEKGGILLRIRELNILKNKLKICTNLEYMEFLKL